MASGNGQKNGPNGANGSGAEVEKPQQHPNFGGMSRKKRDMMKKKVLRLLAKHGIVRYACIGAGISRDSFYKWCHADADFALAAQGAAEASVDAMELEARRRAVHGVRRPVYQKGELVGYVREFSDRLLEIMLRAKRPVQFNDRIQINTFQQTTINQQNVQLNSAADSDPEAVPGAAAMQLSPERRAMLDRIQRIARGEPVE